MTTLTQRYIAAALRAVPAADRSEIERELQAMIADAVQARTDDGEPDDTAVESVLTELGDPTRLAASFTGQLPFLIGPKYFFDYVRLLKILALTVLPISAVAFFFVQAFTTGSLWGSIGATIGVSISVAVHIGFWVTFAFAMAERSATVKMKDITWNLSMLPEVHTGKFKLSDFIAIVASLILVVVVVVWQQLFGIVSGSGVPFLDPELWRFWIPVFFALVAAQLVYEIVKYRVGRWTYGLAAANTAIGVASVIFTIGLVTNEVVLNPEFRELVDWQWSASTAELIPLVAIIVVAGSVVWSSVDSFVRARREAAIR